MGKRRKKQKSGIQGERAAKPEFILEAVEPTPEFKARHALERVKTDQGAYTLRVRDKRPIDKYHRLYLIDEDNGIGEKYRRGISEDQYRAADRLACNYERSLHNTCKAVDIVSVQASVNGELYPVESIVNAIHLHVRMMKRLSRGSQEIVKLICCDEKSLLAYEQSRAWRKGYGMIRFREALDELVAAFRSLGGTKYKNE